MEDNTKTNVTDINNGPTIIKTDNGVENGQNKCPKCGATDISPVASTGHLRCNFCHYEFEPEKFAAMMSDIDALNGKVIGSGAQDIVSDASNIVTFKCSSCGAEVVVDTASSMQARCHWCRHILSVNEQIPNGSVPDTLLPFKVSNEEAEGIIKGFVNKRKFFANPKFKKEFTTNNIIGVFFRKEYSMEAFANIISFISGFLYSYILIALLIAAGLYFTIKTGFIQFRLFGESIRVIAEKREDRESISSFQALMVSTASRVGTGNVVGVTGAIIAGGAGAVFWMWLIAIIGSASAFIESTLAQIYKKKGEHGSYGGPAYYIKQGLGSPLLGGAFAVALILTYMGGFNALASFNMTDFIKVYVPGERSSLYIGAIVAVLAGIVILGGGKRISQVTEVLVPIMAGIYILAAVIIVLLHIQTLPLVFVRIFREAFSAKSVFGGLLGAAMMNGIKRGLYSNEAGIGSAPNAAASADVSHPAKQGLVQMLSVFIDTILICSSTAFMILCTNLDASAYVDAAGNTMNAAYIQDSLVANFGPAGSVFITVALTLFAFTTLVGNYFYAEMNISYLYPKATKNKPFMLFYRLLAAVIIFMGAQFSAGLAWDLADVLMGIMALINVPSCLIMGKTACKALADYRKQKSEGKNPVFHAADIGLSGTDYWIETE